MMNACVSLQTIRFRNVVATAVCLIVFLVSFAETAQASANPPSGKCWIIKPGYGVGPVRLGMTFDDVYSCFGQHDERDGDVGNSFIIKWTYRCGNGTLSLYYHVDYKNVNSIQGMFSPPYVVRGICIRGDAPCVTDEGIKPSSSARELFKIMGRGNTMTGDPSKACRRYYPGLEVSTDNGRIVYMDIHDRADGYSY